MRFGIKLRKGKWELLERVENIRKGIAIFSLSILAIFFISLPILILTPIRKPTEKEKISGEILLSIGEMLSRMKLKEEELLRDREDERKRAEELRIISHVILNSLPFPIILISPDKKILNINRASEEYFKTTATSSLYKTINSILSPALLKFIEQIDKIGNGKEETIREEGRWLRISVAPVKGEKDFLGWIFMLQDITERKKDEEILKEMEKMASLGEMASYLAHEIKNSINIATGFLKLSEKKDDYSEIINIELNSIHENIERFLDFARPLQLKKEEISLKLIISEVVTNFPEIFITFEGDFPVLNCDRALMKIVFFNLIKNSIEAGSTLVKFVSYWKEGYEKVVIDVIDDGKGIPNDKMDKIFLPFFSTKEKGAGLGLSLSRKIILHHGGDIKALPSEKGAKIRFSLPVTK